MLHETVIGGNSNSRPIPSLFLRLDDDGLRGGIGRFGGRGGRLPGVTGRLGRIAPKRQERRSCHQRNSGDCSFSLSAALVGSGWVVRGS